MATEELPEIHAAYIKYVEELSTEPTTPTQLLNWSQKQEIAGVSWSKCSKYFKILNGEHTETKKQHHKTSSGPLLLRNNSSAPIPQKTKNTITIPSFHHRRTQSALDATTHKQNITKNEKNAFETVMIDALLSDIKEDETSSDKRIEKHPLLNKRWNKHKSSIWHKNRIPMTYDLKKWLTDNKFDKFIAKLYHYGIESIDDLRALNTEDIIDDLCGVNHVKMTIIYRRKFIKKVLQFNMKYHKENDTYLEEKQFESETDALKALTKKIKQTTKSIRITKQIESEIEENIKSVKESIITDFDELIKQIALRKKQLLQSINNKHKMSVSRLRDQYTNICDTAMMLLITQKRTSQHIRNTKPSVQRKDDVIGLIHSCFGECNNSYVANSHFKYTEGESVQIKEYGKLMFNDEQLL